MNGNEAREELDSSVDTQSIESKDTKQQSTPELTVFGDSSKEDDQPQNQANDEIQNGVLTHEEDEALISNDGSSTESKTLHSHTQKKKKRRRQPKRDVEEQKLLGRRALCKRIADIAPNMLKTVKLRVLGRYLNSTRGLNDSALTACISKEARKLSNKTRILETINKIDPDANRRTLKEIIIYTILLQEESHSLEENQLAEKVVSYEKGIIEKAKHLDFFDSRNHDPVRSNHYDTYRIVLDAAWRNEDDVSRDEAALLRVLRDRLNISSEDHRLIGAYLKRFPKANCEFHTHDEIHDARKELQRESLMWSYRDENNFNIDVIPYEIVTILREHVVGLELQRKNYERILQHESILLTDLRNILEAHEMDPYGNKADLIERILNSDIKPSQVLDELERSKLSEMCRLVGLKSSGNKQDFIKRLIEFYDDLSFEVIDTQDEREEWYNNYQLLAARAYSDLKAKKLINKDLDIEHQFEKATDFLFEVMLNVPVDKRRKITKADGRIPQDNNQVILWDCKSVEGAVNLQDHLEEQFDSYLRREREKGNQPLAFLVIGPAFSPQSIKLAHQYKARTNWDVALVEAGALKYLSDKWTAMEPDKPFPIRLLIRTGIIDKDKVEFLLSLA